MSEANAVAAEKFTVTIADNSYGDLSASGPGVTKGVYGNNGNVGLTITGSLAQVNSDLATLSDSDAVAGNNNPISISATGSFGNIAQYTVPVAVSALFPELTRRPAVCP